MRVVTITEAAAGMARATARRFAASCVPTELVARHRERLEDATVEVRGVGSAGAAAGHRGRRRDGGGRGGVRPRLREDTWFDGAMGAVRSPVVETTLDEYRHVSEATTVHGPLLALRRMLPLDRSPIVQVVSTPASVPIPRQSAYCGAPQSATPRFSNSLRSELLHGRVAVNLTAVPLSAVSRPQFDLARHRVSRRPQPVPPTFEQEAIAAAIHVAAHHRRREPRLGASAIKAILSAKLAPGLGDRLHADRAHGGQMTDEPDRHRAGNLIETVPGGHGARERVGRRASGFAPAMWLGEHRGVVASLGLPAVAGVAAALVAPSRSGLRRP